MQTNWTYILFSFFLASLMTACSGIQTNFEIVGSEINSEGVVQFNNKIDILFVIDSSHSMTQYRSLLADKIDSFISKLNSAEMDYQIAVSNMNMETTDPSCFQKARRLVGTPTYITKANSHLLKSRLIVDTGTCPVTKGLDAMAYVTSEAYQRLSGFKFMRPDAFLSIIFISDEDDSSFEFGPTGTKDFIKILNERKANVPGYKMGWNANFVGYLNNLSTCDFLGVVPSTGKRYMHLAEYSSGVSLPICNSNFQNIINTISKKMIQLSRTIRFTSVPDQASIQVYINDVLVPRSKENGWDLHEKVDENGQLNVELIFNGTHQPTAQQTVKVFFKPQKAN